VALDELYKEVILDHYKNPRNKHALPQATVSRRKNNPLCGDDIALHAQFTDDLVAEVAFEGQGCSISQASASMLTEAVKGKNLKAAAHLASEFRAMMQGSVDPDEDEFGDLVALKGVVKYPVRIKCAVLAWDVLQEALEEPSDSRGS
jgi:nitrogen fixation protein NifU and related proteins